MSALLGQEVGACQTVLVRDPISGMLTRVAVYYTADGKPVIDRPNSHMSQRAAKWMPQAVAMVNTQDRPYLREEVEFPFVIGSAVVVPTSAGDDIVYVMRDKQEGYSRAVRGRQPIPTSQMTIILKRREEDALLIVGDDEPEELGYVLITAQLGIRGPEIADVIKSQARTRQYEPQLWQAAREFWRHHAFCLELTLHRRESLTIEPPPEWRALLEESSRR